jgi:hypothetical protein
MESQGKKVLRLTLKKKWFDMISSGEKKEEYREIKPYWKVRLTDQKKIWARPQSQWKFNKFDVVEFKNGYGKNAPTITVEFKGISIGKAKSEWSDNWQGDVFIIKLG